MALLPSSVQNLIDAFLTLPGIGPRTAERLTFYLLKASPEELIRFAESLQKLQKDTVWCSTCHNLSETNPCPICVDTTRSRDILCVVEEPLDMIAIEQTGEYKGVYHVLHGSLSPVDGIGPKDIHLDDLVARIDKEKIREVVLATNPSLEGEATALYIAGLLKNVSIAITRIARGIPTGGDVEYADAATLANALKGRIAYRQN